MKTSFRKELEKLINSESMENGSDTPDFLLAEFLCDVLEAWDRTVMAREKWYGREPQKVPAHLCPKEPAPTTFDATSALKTLDNLRTTFNREDIGLWKQLREEIEKALPRTDPDPCPQCGVRPRHPPYNLCLDCIQKSHLLGTVNESQKGTT